jgi:hypothetical protein
MAGDQPRAARQPADGGARRSADPRLVWRSLADQTEHTGGDAAVRQLVVEALLQPVRYLDQVVPRIHVTSREGIVVAEVGARQRAGAAVWVRPVRTYPGRAA